MALNGYTRHYLVRSLISWNRFASLFGLIGHASDSRFRSVLNDRSHVMTINRLRILHGIADVTHTNPGRCTLVHCALHNAVSSIKV